MLEKINQSVQFILEKVGNAPEVGIILGTGLGGLVREIEVTHVLEYQNIPNFPVSTVEGHKGKLISEIFQEKGLLLCRGGSITTKDIPCRKLLSRFA